MPWNPEALKFPTWYEQNETKMLCLWAHHRRNHHLSQGRQRRRKDMRCELHLQNDLPEEFLIRVAVAELEKNAPTLH
jgi:hypothetical protein